VKIEINTLQYKEYSSELSIMSGTVHETPLSSSSSSSSSSTPGGGMTIDIRPMIEDVSQVMTKHITSILSGVIGEYTIYKETHDTIMGLPCVRKLHERIMELEQRTESKKARFVYLSFFSNGLSSLWISANYETKINFFWRNDRS
jgi:hypothetical protein